MATVSSSQRPARTLALAALIAVLVAALVTACGAPTSPSRPAISESAVGLSALAPSAPTTQMSVMTVGQLPQQAVDTLGLITAGGPFPYAKDGAVFSNREGQLPFHPSGWYREYTVITPDSTDRGARRIISGKDGARFYTFDHYATFREVVST